jgi:magnesium transporter
MDQEEVAGIFRRYDMLAVPVVDENGIFLGRITVDDVVDVMREEAEEDIARMAGTVEEEFDEPSVRRVSFLRLPWILISLFGGLLAGGVLRHFTGSLGMTALFLVAFVPVITAMGGNAGSQAAITMVRRLALHPVGATEAGNIVWREARIGVLLGLICGLIVGGVAFVWRGEGFYGVVVGVAMAVAILVAATMGTLVPLFFHRVKVDPAIATGPFVSMSNDVVGLLIYFGLATFLLKVGGALPTA